METRRVVVIFKAEQDDDKYVEELNKIGFECRLIPVLKFTFQNSQEIVEVLIQPEDYSGIILTSPRAVEAVKYATENVTGWDNDLKLKWSKLLTFVVGETTADLSRLIGLNPTGENSGNAEALSEVIKNHFSTSGDAKPLFFPCGNLARDKLVDKLNKSLIPVKRLVVYTTEPHDDIEKNFEVILQTEKDKIHSIVYFSPSGVKYTKPFLEKINFPIDQYKWFAIGSTTADAMIKAGLPVSSVAEKPSPHSLAEIIKLS